MFPSDRFLARIAKGRKTGRTESPEVQVEMIRRAFIELNRHIPISVLDALLDHFTADLMEGPSDSPFDRCGRLAEVMDVLAEQYDEKTDPLGRPDWQVIGAVISDNATDLDMEFVTYVMRLAVDHGAV